MKMAVRGVSAFLANFKGLPLRGVGLVWCIISSAGIIRRVRRLVWKFGDCWGAGRFLRLLSWKRCDLIVERWGEVRSEIGSVREGDEMIVLVCRKAVVEDNGLCSGGMNEWIGAGTLEARFRRASLCKVVNMLGLKMVVCRDDVPACFNAACHIERP